MEIILGGKELSLFFSRVSLSYILISPLSFSHLSLSLSPSSLSFSIHSFISLLSLLHYLLDFLSAFHFISLSLFFLFLTPSCFHPLSTPTTPLSTTHRDARKPHA